MGLLSNLEVNWPNSTNASRSLSQEEQHLFAQEQLQENVPKLQFVAVAGILVNMVFMGLDLVQGDEPLAVFMRMVWIVCGVIYLLGAQIGMNLWHRDQNPPPLLRPFLLVNLTLTMFFASAITGIMQQGYGQSFLFVSVAMVIAAFFVLSKWERVFVFSPGILILIWLAIVGQNQVFSRAEYLLNYLAIIVFVGVVSTFAWRNKQERFLHLRQIEDQRQRLQVLSEKDGLTGLSNRRRLDQFLQSLASVASRQPILVSVLMIDIDWFKRYNDMYGHQAGDQVLVQVGQALSTCVSRSSDLLGRYGGEEFLAILPGNDREGAYNVGEALRQKVQQLSIDHPKSAYNAVTVSVGVASAVLEEPGGIATLIGAADQALYRAKSGGRNQVCVAELLEQ